MSDVKAGREAQPSAVVSQPAPTPYEATIERVFSHTFDTRSFFLRLPDERRLNFKPGQFISLLLPVAGEILTRPYSIASSPKDGNLLEICLNLVPDGPGSHYLFARNLDEVLRFTGPWGTFVLDTLPEAECVFIADGTGIAPIRPMIHHAFASAPRSPILLLYSTRQESEFLYRDELVTLTKKSPRFVFAPLVTTPANGGDGVHGSLLTYVQSRFIDQDNDRSRHFYICGVGSQVTQLRDLLRRAGYQRRAVHYEKW
jgi:CDP-4-dehydro-6-deoxyglucose reductase